MSTYHESLYILWEWSIYFISLHHIKIFKTVVAWNMAQRGSLEDEDVDKRLNFWEHQWKIVHFGNTE
jgi:hypothetical protein